MIGKRILDYIKKCRPKVGDAQLPTRMVKGVAVEIDFTAVCTIHNLTETMEQLQTIKDQIIKDRKTLHFSMETRIIVGEGIIPNVPIWERENKTGGVVPQYYCETCGEVEPAWVPICPKCKEELQLAIQEMEVQDG